MKKNGVIVLLVVIILGLGGYLVYDKLLNNDSETLENKEELSKRVITEEEARVTIQNLYEKAYDVIGEGSDLRGTQEIIDFNNKQHVCYKMDFSKIEQYFTDRAMAFIKNNVPDYVSNSNYYECDESFFDKYESKKTFFDSIFGVTDQGIRDLNVKIYDNNTIVATSKCGDRCYKSVGYDEYIVAIKVNDTWKIDMYE